MKKIKLIIRAFFFLVSLQSIAQEKIDPILLNEINSSDKEYFSAIIMLQDQADIATLSEELEGQTREFTHQQVVESLQKKAQSTQTSLNQYLSDNDSVKEYQNLWIINAIIVVAQKSIILNLSQREDVGYIYLNYEIEYIEPVEQQNSLEIATSIEPGLQLINADCLWSQGITGAGRIVSNLDTGVDGHHPALTNKWRGNTPGITIGESWFDPNGISPSFPSDSGIHGTHTMGTMVGSTPGDIIGVAYDAQWIAAAVIDIGGLSGTIANALLAFQWSADPDGNPATVTDVPDVSSNSWGLSPIYGHVPTACDNTFWSAIDNLEAATVVVVFAAGNEGSGSSTLRTPADRATTLLNGFSVGALDTTGSNIASYSSRGPSLCSGPAIQLIKPEVVARGSSVRSSIPGGGYTNLSGTSMATPHVSGAVALLRQVNPNATVNQIKTALMQSAIDLGIAGEDNDYGHGLIDVCLAATLITPCPTTLNISTNIIPPTVDTQQASSTINASNTINSGATGIYHAGDEVLLSNGFTSINGSIFRGYIEGCTNNFAARNIPITSIINSEESLEPQTLNEYIKVAPNPSNGSFNISLDQLQEGRIEILDLYGIPIYKSEFKNQNIININIQDKPKGIYILKIYSNDQIYTNKIIKE